MIRPQYYLTTLVIVFALLLNAAPASADSYFITNTPKNVEVKTADGWQKADSKQYPLNKIESIRTGAQANGWVQLNHMRYKINANSHITIKTNNNNWRININRGTIAFINSNNDSRENNNIIGSPHGTFTFTDANGYVSVNSTLTRIAISTGTSKISTPVDNKLLKAGKGVVIGNNTKMKTDSITGYELSAIKKVKRKGTGDIAAEQSITIKQRSSSIGEDDIKNEKAGDHSTSSNDGEEGFNAIFSGDKNNNQQKEKNKDKTEEDTGYGSRLWHNSQISGYTNYSFSYNESRQQQVGLFGGSVEETSILTLGTQFQSQIRENRNIFNIDGQLEISNFSDVYSQDGLLFDDSTKRQNLLFSELYYTHGTRRADYTIGKKKMNMGVARIYSPNDRYDRYDFANSINIRREGRWQLGYTHYQGNTSYNIKVMPFFAPHRRPPAGQASSLLLPISGIGAVGNTGQVLERNFPDRPEVLGTIESTYRGWDLFGSFYYGHFGPVVKNVNIDLSSFRSVTGPITQTYADVYNLGAGFSTATRTGWEVHGELLYQKSVNGRDDSFIKGTVGATHNMTEAAQALDIRNMEITFEYAKEEITKDLHHDDIAIGTTFGRPGKDTLMTQWAASGEKGTIYTTARYDDYKKTFSLSGGVQYNMNDNSTFKISSELNALMDDKFEDRFSDWKNSEQVMISYETNL